MVLQSWGCVISNLVKNSAGGKGGDVLGRNCVDGGMMWDELCAFEPRCWGCWLDLF